MSKTLDLTAKNHLTYRPMTEPAGSPEDMITALVNTCYAASKASGWWTEAPDVTQCVVKLALIHSEISEALEGLRKNLDDAHLPQYKAFEVELADALIRIFDLAGACSLPLGEAFAAKLKYNAHRADHKPENRAKENGKKF